MTCVLERYYNTMYREHLLLFSLDSIRLRNLSETQLYCNYPHFQLLLRFFYQLLRLLTLSYDDIGILIQHNYDAHYRSINKYRSR